VEKLIQYYYDCELPRIRKIGIYFAQQGKLLACEILGKCPRDTEEISQGFKEEKRYINFLEELEESSVLQITKTMIKKFNEGNLKIEKFHVSNQIF
jgi:hypothetical protein